jgi:putative DNA methylase
MVNDPGYERHLGRGMNKEKASQERERLFKIIERLVRWENTSNEEVWREAREEIQKSWRETCLLNKNHPQAAELFDPEKVPAFHDPFAGGGALPLEAQRLGLESYAADLNPVAVTVNKAMIEVPPKFAGRSPVGPARQKVRQSRLIEDWTGVRGLAEDVRRYGAWMRAEAEKRVGHAYPKVQITPSMAKDRPDLKPLVGETLTVIAWLWARTVKSPNPAFSHIDVPLISTFILANKEGRESYVEPVIDGDSYHFEIRNGTPPEGAEHGTKAPGRGANFLCLLSKAPISGDYIKAEGQAGRLGTRLMAVVAEGKRARVYLPPDEAQESIALSIQADWRPSGDIPARLTGGTCVPYGLKEWGDIFTSRQLYVLSTLCDLIPNVTEKAKADAVAAGWGDDANGLDNNGNKSSAYAEAIAMYLAFAIDRCTDFSNTCTRWVPGNQKVMNLFGKQSIPITWDFPEAALLENTVGGFLPAAEYIADCIEKLSGARQGYAVQANASDSDLSRNKVISTDPPYYDNIAYADLSDFFYVWLRRSLRPIFPNLFATMAVPKAEELVATAYRHGSKEAAESFFLDGMTSAMRNLALNAHPAMPVTIYYAFKQAETKADEGTASTGWETFLEAVIRAGFSISGTWPMRSEQEFRMVIDSANNP